MIDKIQLATWQNSYFSMLFNSVVTDNRQQHEQNVKSRQTFVLCILFSVCVAEIQTPPCVIGNERNMIWFRVAWQQQQTTGTTDYLISVI